MTESTKEKREKFVFRFSVAVAALSFAAVFVVTGAQIYVRWFINQDFTIIGGNQLEVLTASAFLLILAIAYIGRPGKNSK